MKKRSLIMALIICMLLSFLCDVRYVYAAKTTGQKIEDAQDTYDDSKNKKDKAESDLNSLNQKRDSLMETVEDLNDKLEKASSILEELDTAITNKQNQIDETWARLEALTTAISETQALVDKEYEETKAQIKNAYESGDTFYMALLMGSGEYSSYINRSSYFQMLTDYQQNKIRTLMETKEALQEQQEQYQSELVLLEEETAELDEYNRCVEEQHAEILAMVEEASKRVQEYTDQIEETEAKIEQYESLMNESKNDLETLKTQLQEEKQKTEKAAASDWRDVSDITYRTDDRVLLANIIWCEAGNEPYEGKVAVGAVVMNRVMSSEFPNTISGVIYQKRQFTPASTGKLALALSRGSADEDCYKAADAAMNGVTNVKDCLYFRTPVKSVSPRYVIGGHYFY